MAYSQAIKDKVRQAYIHQRLPLAEAAKANRIPYNTARTWKRECKKHGDDWDRARTAARLVKGGISEVTSAFLEEFVVLFQNTVAGLNEQAKRDPEGVNHIEVAEALSRLADAYTKTTKSVTAGSPQLNKLTIALEVVELLTQFIREHHPQRLKEWVEMLEPFSRRVSEEMG